MLLAIVTSLLVYCKQHLAVDRWGWAYSQDSEQEGRGEKKAGDSEDSETDVKDLETGAKDSDTDAKDLETGAKNSGTVKFGGAQNDRQKAVVAAFRHAWKVGWGLGWGLS